MDDVALGHILGFRFLARDNDTVSRSIRVPFRAVDDVSPLRGQFIVVGPVEARDNESLLGVCCWEGAGGGSRGVEDPALFHLYGGLDDKLVDEDNDDDDDNDED